MVLEPFDIERVQAAARKKGFERWELYREVALVRSYDYRLYEYQDGTPGAAPNAIENRVERTQREGRNGFHFWGMRAGKLERFVSPHAFTGNFFDWLGVSAGLTPPPPKPAHDPLPKERWKSLQHQGRCLTAYQSRGIRNACFRYQETMRRFEVATSAGDPERGSEEEVSASGTWVYRVNSETRYFEKELGSSSIAEFEKLLKGESLFKDSLDGCVGSRAAWPAPRGKFPVYWSKEAMGTLLVHFLKAFEGDLFLDHLSFLIRQEGDLPSSFSVFDEPMPGAARCDSEGVRIKATPIFGDGKARTLATNRSVAEEMQVSPSGHARRQNLDCPSTIGFWRPTVVPRAATNPNLLAGLVNGVRVEQVAVLRFDPASANALIQTRLARLIHHGEFGEWIEPLTWEVNLLELLRSVDTFDGDRGTLGIFSDKRDHRILSEIVTAGCLTRDVHFPGNVPESHYWR